MSARAAMLVALGVLLAQRMPLPASNVKVTYRQASIVWTPVTPTGPEIPDEVAQIRPHYDPVADRAWFPLTRPTNTNNIYASDYYAIDKNGGIVRLGGTGTTAWDCSQYPTPGGVTKWNDGSGSDVQPWLPDGHKDNQSATDGSRLWQWSNLACQNPPAGSGIGYNTLHYLTFNVNPTLARWTKVTGFQTVPLVGLGGSLAYNSKNNVLVLHGFGGSLRTYQFFPVLSGSTCSAVQVAAGCVRANDWVQTHVTDQNFSGGQSYESLMFDLPGTDRVIMFGNYCDGATNGCTTVPWTTGVWEYNVVTHQWTTLTPPNGPTNQASAQFDTSLATITSGPYAGQFHYHRNSHSGTDTGQARDFLYNPATGRWTDLGVQPGVGPQKFTWEVFFPTIGTKGGLIAMEMTGVGQPVKLWKATIQ